MTYDFGPRHPFSPDRWEALAELLNVMNVRAEWVQPEAASDEQILALHQHRYVEAVQAASAGFLGTRGQHFGLGTDDVPIFYGMHHATLEICGGSLKAADLILDGQARRVLQLGGGLHHAMPNRAAGFCVYNDVALLIKRLRDAGLRVAYVDVDVHHGDGVQEFYYEDPDVLTISIHESGQFLFPGTGSIHERGRGHGLGTCINVPLYPGTDDAGYLDAFEAVVPRALASFKPDVLVVEAGADAHFSDPLAHLSLSTSGFEHVFRRLVELSDEWSHGRIAVTLGGGYSFDSSLRVWALLAHVLADQLPAMAIPDAWITKWREHRHEVLHSDLHDAKAPVQGQDLKETIQRANRDTLTELLRLL